MKKQAANRMHNFPDADLYLQSMDRIRFALRDIKEFEKYGYVVLVMYDVIAVALKTRSRPRPRPSPRPSGSHPHSDPLAPRT